MDIKGLKDKILQLAIQGKLVQQDENDEPASVLVERINEEKERLIKEKKIKRQKPLPKITETEKPFKIPKGWEWVRLGDVTNYGIVQSIKPQDIIMEEWVLELEDIEKESSKILQILNNRERQSKSNKYKFSKGDVLYCKLRPYLKKIIVAPREGVCSTEIIPFTGYCNIDPRFIMYYMYSPYTDIVVNNITHGMDMPRLGTKNAINLLFPLPPLEEQKRIVKKVDQLFTLIDKLDSDRDDLLEIINLTRNQVLQEAIQGKLVAQSENDEPVDVLLEKIEKEKEKLIREKKIRKEKPLPEITEEEKPFEIPESWEWVRLGDIGEIVGGGTPQTAIKEYWERGTIAWLTPADLSNYKDKYISRGRRDITPLGLKESSAQLMPKGTVLFSSRAPIGYTVIAQNEISTNQGFKSCIPFIMDMNEYLYYYLIYSARVINENASGTTFKEVSGTEVKNLIFPLPSLEEQKRIVKKVDTIMAMLDKLASELII